MFKVNNRNTRTRGEICSKLTIKTLERRHSSVSIVDFIVGKKYVISTTEFEMLRLLKPILRSFCVSSHEIRANPIETGNMHVF